MKRYLTNQISMKSTQ